MSLLLPFQRFFLPALLTVLVWAVWRTVFRRDLAVGLALYLGLVIIVDGFLNTGIFIAGLEQGSIRYSEVCAAVLLFSRPPASPHSSPHGSAIRFLVGLYFVFLFISAFRSDPMIAGIFDFRRLVVPQIIALVIAMRGVHAPADFRRFFLSLTALSLVVGLFVFWDVFFDQWLIRSEMLSKPEYFVNRRHGRFGGFFLNPNYLGAFTVLIFPAMFVWTTSENTRVTKFFAGTGLLSLAFCLVETQSRGPLLAFGIALFLMLLGPGGGVSRTRRMSMFLSFIALFALFMPGFLEHATERFEDVQQEITTEGARTRRTTWQYTQRAIAEYPLAGIGFGEQQFLKVMSKYGFETVYGTESLDNPHNSYLQMAVYAGIPALISFVFANALLLLRAASVVLRSRACEYRHVTFGLAVGIAGFLAVIYPDMHMFTQTVAPAYWLFFGLLFSLVVKTREQAPAVVHDQTPAAVLHGAPIIVRRVPATAVRRPTPIGERP